MISDFNREAWVVVSASPDHWEVDAIDNPCTVRVSGLIPLRPLEDIWRKSFVRGGRPAEPGW